MVVTGIGKSAFDVKNDSKKAGRNRHFRPQQHETARENGVSPMQTASIAAFPQCFPQLWKTLGEKPTADVETGCDGRGFPDPRMYHSAANHREIGPFC
jgi:hypothetical protein